MKMLGHNKLGEIITTIKQNWTKTRLTLSLDGKGPFNY